MLDAGTFGIRIQALDKGRFGKANAELFTFAHANYCEISPNNQKAYMIFDSHIAEVVDRCRDIYGYRLSTKEGSAKPTQNCLRCTRQLLRDITEQPKGLHEHIAEDIIRGGRE